MINLNLKPCPFCGKEVEVYAISYDKYRCVSLKIACCMEFYIQADELTVYGSNAFREGKDAIEKWNRRASNE